MSAPQGRLRVEILDRGRLRPLPPTEVDRLLRSAGRCVGSPPGEVAVLFTGDAEIRGLNRSFRSIDRPTDVLAFPDGRLPAESEPRIGDIVISVPTARRNAQKSGHSLRREIRQLLVHGFLHLMGFDHEVDDGEMASLESAILARHASRPARR